MSVKKYQESNGIAKLKMLNIEIFNEQEQNSIKGGGTKGVIEVLQPD